MSEQQRAWHNVANAVGTWGSSNTVRALIDRWLDVGAEVIRAAKSISAAADAMRVAAEEYTRGSSK